MRIVLAAILVVAFAALANAAAPPAPGGGIGKPGDVAPWVKDRTAGAGGTTEGGSNVDRNADTKQQDPCMVYTQDRGWQRKANCNSSQR